MSQFLVFPMDSEQNQLQNQRQQQQQSTDSFRMHSNEGRVYDPLAALLGDSEQQNGHLMHSGNDLRFNSSSGSPRDSSSYLTPSQGVGIGPHALGSSMDNGIQQQQQQQHIITSGLAGTGSNSSSGNVSAGGVVSPGGSSSPYYGGSVPYISLNSSLTSPPQSRLPSYSPILQMSSSETSSPLLSSLGNSRSSPSQAPLSLGQTSSPLMQMSSFDEMRDPDARRNTFDSPLFFQNQLHQEQQQPGLFFGTHDLHLGQQQQSQLGFMNDSISIQQRIRPSSFQSLPQLNSQPFHGSVLERSFSASSAIGSTGSSKLDLYRQDFGSQQTFGMNSSPKFTADAPPFVSSSFSSSNSSSLNGKPEGSSDHTSEDVRKGVEAVATPAVLSKSDSPRANGVSSPSQFSPSNPSMVYSPPGGRLDIRRQHKIHIQPPQYTGENGQHSASSTFVSVQQLFRTKPCRFFFEKGTCLKGDRCNFSHDPVFAAQYAEAHAKELGALVGNVNEGQKIDGSDSPLGQDASNSSGANSSGASKITMYRINSSSGITIYRNTPSSEGSPTVSEPSTTSTTPIPAPVDDSSSSLTETDLDSDSTVSAATTTSASLDSDPSSAPISRSYAMNQHYYPRRGGKRRGYGYGYAYGYGPNRNNGNSTYAVTTPASVSHEENVIGSSAAVSSRPPSLSEFPPLN